VTSRLTDSAAALFSCEPIFKIARTVVLQFFFAQPFGIRNSGTGNQILSFALLELGIPWISFDYGIAVLRKLFKRTQLLRDAR